MHLDVHLFNAGCFFPLLKSARFDVWEYQQCSTNDNFKWVISTGKGPVSKHSTSSRWIPPPKGHAKYRPEGGAGYWERLLEPQPVDRKRKRTSAAPNGSADSPTVAPSNVAFRPPVPSPLPRNLGALMSPPLNTGVSAALQRTRDTMQAEWDECIRKKIPVPYRVSAWMDLEHKRVLGLVTEGSRALEKANEDKRKLAADINQLVEDLNAERTAHDIATCSNSTLKTELQELSATLGLAQHNFGCLRWENFARCGDRAERHINDLTGVRSVELFLGLYDLFNIKGAAESLQQRNMTLEYTNNPRLKGRKLRPIDGMFLCMIRLRTGMTSEHVAWLFGVGVATVSRVFEMWLMHMHVCFQVCFPPPDAKMRQHSCPKEFIAKFKTDYAYIVDCSDLEMQVGSDPQIQYATWSDYHHFNGAKFLGAVTPCGAFAYSSKAYPARATDNAVTELCGFLEYLEKGDTIVADKGFTVFYLLNKLEVSLYIPPFKRVG